QYLAFLGGLTRGDLGNSINTRRAITTDIGQFLPATIELSTVAILLALAIGLPLGVFSALYRDGPIDHVARFVSLIGVSIPIFWLAILALVIFYATLHVTAGPGRLGPGLQSPPSVTGFYLVDSLLAGNFTAFRSALSQLVLPSCV